MKRIMAFTFEPDKQQLFHSFSEELCKAYDRSGIDVVGVYNGVRIDVNEYENIRSLFWQYEYKRLIQKTNKILVREK